MTATNIYIRSLNRNIAFPTIAQLLNRLKSYPTFPDGFSLKDGENQDYPVQFITVRGKRCDRLYIELTVRYPCPEFSELYRALDKKHLQWLIHHITVYDSADEPHYFFNLDEFFHNFFPLLWNHDNMPTSFNTSISSMITSYSLPSPVSPSNSPLALPP